MRERERERWCVCVCLYVRLEGWNAKNYLQATLGIKKKNPVLEIKEVPGARLVQLLKLELLQKAFEDILPWRYTNQKIVVFLIHMGQNSGLTTSLSRIGQPFMYMYILYIYIYILYIYYYIYIYIYVIYIIYTYTIYTYIIETYTDIYGNKKSIPFKEHL